MKENWDKAISFVLAIEGGYNDDPSDPGKATNHGISLKSYPDLGVSGIKNLTLDEAKDIYKRDYWTKCGCDDIESGRDILVFDTAVNMGVSVAINFLTQSESWQDYLLYRIDRYIEISRKNVSLQKFFRGWIIRCSRISKLIREA